MRERHSVVIKQWEGDPKHLSKIFGVSIQGKWNCTGSSVPKTEQVIV